MKVSTIIALFILVSGASALADCSTALKTVLNGIAGQAIGPETQYFERRYGKAFPELFALAPASERGELVTTLHSLDFHRNRSAIESELERKFIQEWKLAMTGNLPATQVHEKYRLLSIDPEQFTHTYRRAHMDQEGSGIAKIVDPRFSENRLEKLAKKLDQKFETNIATDAEALKNSESLAFYRNQHAYVDSDGALESRPTLMIQELDFYYGTVTPVTRHELVHLLESQNRMKMSGGSFDTAIKPIGNKSLNVTGYDQFMSYEEVKAYSHTIPQECIRASNSQILQTFKNKKSLPLHKVFDLEEVERSTRTISSVALKTFETSGQTIKELKRMKMIPVERSKVAFLRPTIEGYEFKLPVADSYYSITQLSNPIDFELAQSVHKELRRFETNPDPLKRNKVRELRNKLYDRVIEKLEISQSRSQSALEASNRIATRFSEITNPSGSIISRDEYLDLRDLLIKQVQSVK